MLARVACDQCIFAPTILAVFLSTMAMLEGSEPQKKLDAAYEPALTKNWMVWPWVQMANFKFVPLEHRVLVVNVISLGEFLDQSLKTGSEYVDLVKTTIEETQAKLSIILGWNCYLSYLNSQGGNSSGDSDLPPT